MNYLIRQKILKLILILCLAMVVFPGNVSGFTIAVFTGFAMNSYSEKREVHKGRNRKTRKIRGVLIRTAQLGVALTLYGIFYSRNPGQYMLGGLILSEDGYDIALGFNTDLDLSESIKLDILDIALEYLSSPDLQMEFIERHQSGDLTLNIYNIQIECDLIRPVLEVEGYEDPNVQDKICDLVNQTI